ncbi:MAG: hypothetical protein J5663_04195 [Bacteroidaceae bacterium]|nr:hypothetical protein [Bacteroidaceae bacterium]
MNKKEYMSPSVTLRHSQLRASLLAGSGANLSNGKNVNAKGLGGNLTGGGSDKKVTGLDSMLAW